MQTGQIKSNNTQSQLIPPVKTGKKRGRPALPFVAKPTPSALVLSVLTDGAQLSFDDLQARTKLGEDKLCQALTTLVINTKQIYSFTRKGVRLYTRLQQSGK